MASLKLFAIVFAVFGVLLFTTQVEAFSHHGNQTVDPTQIKKVHLVFMNHLDVGYDGIYPTIGFALNVINKYFKIYYPRAVSVSNALRIFGFTERLIYTTHPWLLYMYLHCPDNLTLASNVTLMCPNSSDVDALRYTISNGDVAWHAGPMNMEYEVMHPDLLDMSLTFGELLDKEFGITRTTPVVSQRDVPGMTKAVLPIFKKHKIAGITVGVNTMTSPPAVPSTPFIWKFSPDDKDEDGIIAFWHPGGYPDNAGLYPAKPGGMSVKDCLFAQDVAAFPETLCFVFRTDNSGPPENVNEVLMNFEVARGQFPNAKIQASTLDDYVSALKQSRTTYPVVTQEVGDTWVMGIQSDPKKIALYRCFAKVMADCFRTGKCSLDDGRVLQAVHYLTKLPEHTWGLDTINDFKNWSNKDFMKAKSGQKYTNCTAAWKEQRQFMDLAFEALGSHPVTNVLRTAAKELTPKMPDLSDYKAISPTDQQTCSDGMVLQFGYDGSLSKLYDPYNKVDWATPNSALGQVLYSTYNESDYDYMSQLYDYFGGAGFHKTNSTQYAKPESRSWSFKILQLYRKKDGSCDFMVVTGPESSLAYTKYGAPPMFYIQFKTANQTPGTKGGLDVVLQWFNKVPTRLSEAVSFGFTPMAPAHNYKWLMSKLDSVVDPTDVILNGSQWLHAINRGVYYKNPSGGGLEILSEDVALLLFGTDFRPPSVIPVPLDPIVQPIRTAAFNLYNNFWNTNYIYWYPFFPEDEDFKARFSIHFV